MKKFLDKIHIPRWLEIFLLILLILRIPSFFEPYSYGDEMIYLSLGEALRHGKTLYLTIHDNKPPFLYLLAGLAGSLFWFKVILSFWMLTTTVIFWKLSRILFEKKEKVQKIATLIFGFLTTLPLLEGNIANAELFMIGPTMIAFMLLLSEKLNFKKLFTAGLLFSFSSLFKIPAAFDMPAIIFFWLIIGGLKRKSLVDTFKKGFIILSGFLLPILISFVWYWTKGAFYEYLVAAYLQNVGYLSSFRPGDVREPFLVRNLPLLIRSFVVVIGLGILTIFRKKFSKPFIFITIWLLFGLFAVTLSERPYPHYLIQVVPSLSFLFAMLFGLKSLEQTLVIFPLGLAFLVPSYFRFWYYPTSSYYVKFVNFATKKIPKNEYLASFNSNTERSYALADFITKSTKRSDPVFIWGEDSSIIYALSRRLPPIKYVADYHIRDFSSKEEVAEKLKSTLPKIIILLPNAPSFGEITLLLREDYVQVEDIKGAEIWTLITPEVKNQFAH